MIKANVKVCGTLKGGAKVNTKKADGSQYLSFVVAVVIPAKTGINKTVDIMVWKSQYTEKEAEDLAQADGFKVDMEGVLAIHKKGDELTFNLSASSVSLCEDSNEDAITGEMHFRGTVGKQVDIKKDKRDKEFLVFSAFSTDVHNNQKSFAWVSFMRFPSGDEPVAKEDWLMPKSFIEAKGELQISVYNDKINIACKLSELNQAERRMPQNATNDNAN